VLGVFFLLVWVTVIAALTSTERQRRARLLLPGQVDEDFQAALGKADHVALARYYRVALSRRPGPQDEQLIRINLACALNGLKEYEQALEELDRVSLKHLQPSQVALWLNNRAYTLTFLGRPEDALDNLRDAEDLLAGDDGLAKDLSLLACISGTRGIALFRKGDLDVAEKALELALRLEGDSVSYKFDPDVDVNPARTSERWWWLSEIAQARGDQAVRREHLSKAAAHPFTEFGARALAALRDGQALPAGEPAPAGPQG
jgi:tetratricopeptide (TPR) repeat protein